MVATPRPAAHPRQDALGIGSAVDFLGPGLDVGNQGQQVRLGLRQPGLQLFDVGHLGGERAQQRIVLPLAEIAGQQAADFLKAEACLLGRRDQFEHDCGFSRVGAIAIGPPLDLKQADAFVETDARGGDAAALGQFADLH